MRERTLDVIDLERASDALTDLARAHHEVLDEELAASVEQVGQRQFAIGRVADVLLVDLHPGQRPTVGGTHVAAPRSRLSPFAQGSPRRPAASTSRNRVSSFSFTKRALRASSHSVRVTIL